MAGESVDAMLAAALAQGESAVHAKGSPDGVENPLSAENPQFDGPPDGGAPGAPEPADDPMGGIPGEDVDALQNLLAADDDDIGGIVENLERAVEDEEDLDAPDEAASGDEEQPVDPAVARDLDKARTALKREQWTDEELEGLSPESLLAKGKRAREAEADRERLRQRLELLEEGKAEAPAVDSVAPTTEAPADLSELTSLLASELGEEVSKPFAAFAEGLAAKTAAMENMVNTLVAQQVSTAETSERQRVGERFPDLLDDDTYAERVRPELETLAQLPKYRGKGIAAFPELLEKAALLAGLERADPEAEAAASEAKAQATSRKRAGTAKGPGRARQTLTKLSEEQLQAASIEALERYGKDSRRFKNLASELRSRAGAG